MIDRILPDLAEVCQDKAVIAQSLANIRRVDAKGRGKRLRAAMGYAGLDNADVTKLLNISESTLARLKRGNSKLTDEFAAKLARHCKLPVEFFDMDFSSVVDQPTISTSRRFENAETQIASLWDSLSRLDQRLLQVEQDLHEQQLAETAERTGTQTGTSARSAPARGDRRS